VVPKFVKEVVEKEKKLVKIVDRIDFFFVELGMVVDVVVE
jgi:hypothetical protein